MAMDNVRFRDIVCVASVFWIFRNGGQRILFYRANKWYKGFLRIFNCNGACSTCGGGYDIIISGTIQSKQRKI